MLQLPWALAFMPAPFGFLVAAFCGGKYLQYLRNT
jgi:hypothetical protein